MYEKFVDVVYLKIHIELRNKECKDDIKYCSTMRRRIEGAASTINATMRAQFFLAKDSVHNCFC